MQLSTEKGLKKFFLLCISIFIISPLITPSVKPLNEMGDSNTLELPPYNLESSSARGVIDVQENQVFWFIHVTDTQHIWYDADKIKDFKQFLEETDSFIKPVIIYNTGDLVDSDYGNFILPNERDQRIEEWERYRAALEDTDMDSSKYMDVIGNHDVYGDNGNTYFLNYSMMGSTYGTMQHAFTKSFSFGKYAFIGLHTAEDYGAQYPFGLFGHLSTQEMTWYENRLDDYQNCNKRIVFGHHPPFEINYFDTSSSGKTFFTLNKEHDTNLYLCGHGHMNSFEKIDNMIAIETTKFDDDGGTYRIVAFDHDQLSTSLEHVGKWPQGMITYPPRDRYLIKTLSEAGKIRALAWDPQGVNSVRWCAFKADGKTLVKDWESMDRVSSYQPLWEADWNELEGYNNFDNLLLKIEIDGGSGKVIKQLNYSSQLIMHFGWQQGMPIIIITFFLIISLIIMGNTYRRIKIPKFKKKPEEIVDKGLRNIYLLKLAIFLVMPLTLAGMFIGKITVVFSFFYLNEYGILFNGVNLLFNGVTLLICFLLQPFRLSYKNKDKLIIDSIISIGFTTFLIVFYILHYPSLSWISPGYYGMIILDVLMIKRSKRVNITSKQNLTDNQ